MYQIYATALSHFAGNCQRVLFFAVDVNDAGTGLLRIGLKIGDDVIEHGEATRPTERI